MSSTSAHIVVYSLLGAVVAALMLSFLQLYKKDYNIVKTFVPRPYIYLQKGIYDPLNSLFLDKLVFNLTQTYHCMTLFFLYSSENVPVYHIDSLYHSWIIHSQKDQEFICTVTDLSGNQWNIQVEKNDILTLPFHLKISFNLPIHCTILEWGLYPIVRPFKTCKQEKLYIQAQWKKKKCKIMRS